MRLAPGLIALLLAACGPRAVLGTHPRAPGDFGPPGADLASSDLSDPELRHTSSATRVPPPATRSPSAVLGSALHVDAQDLLDLNVTAVSASPAHPTSGIVISRLPAPHRVAAADAPTPSTVADARTLAGHRDPRDPVAFALAVAASLGPAPMPALRTGPALVAWAREQGIFASVPDAPTAPTLSLAPGDLLVFDRAVENAPASLVAVALVTDARGVTEFLYLARGVIRTGHLDLSRPGVARDREGRSVNSYLRHGTDHPPAGTRYLAGELLGGRIRP